jgi:hypothetical protein
MKGLTALVLLAIAVGAVMHFWPSPGQQQPSAPSASGNASSRAAPVEPWGSPTSAQQSPTTSALSPERAQPGTVERPPVTAVQIEIRAPDTVRSGDTFPVTIDVRALRGIRHLAFSVTYKKSILQLIGSSPGAFAQQGATPVQLFEESSDGYLLVRVDLESGVIAGVNSVAVLEFHALKRGVSPLSVHGVTYIEGGRQDTATAEDHEGSITVD